MSGVIGRYSGSVGRRDAAWLLAPTMPHYGVMHRESRQRPMSGNVLSSPTTP